MSRPDGNATKTLIRHARRKPERRVETEVASIINRLTVSYRSPGSLKLYRRNAKKHSAKQIRQIAASIQQFGFTNPLLIDENNEVIAGHGRLEAALLLGLEEVPTICLRGLSAAAKSALRIADNKIAENAGWDLDLLAEELQALSNLDLDFDLTVTGFETAEIDLFIQNCSSDGIGNVEDEVEPIDPSIPAVSQVGDLWILEKHLLLCADATKSVSYQQLLGRKKAEMVFVDPPYNVRIDGNVCGSGAIKHREFPMASGEMSEFEFSAFLKASLGNIVNYSADGSIHFICMDWRHLYELLGVVRAIYSEIKNICVWNKDNGGMGSLYRSKHEEIVVCKNGSGAHINNVELGRFGRNRTNVWNYPSANSLRDRRRDELAMHPTTKPVALVSDAILDCSKRGGLILDSFGGSGTTLIAAEKTGRRACLIELDPIYVDLAIGRFQKLTGKEARHAVTGQTFAEIQRKLDSQQIVKRQKHGR